MQAYDEAFLSTTVNQNRPVLPIHIVHFLRGESGRVVSVWTAAQSRVFAELRCPSYY